MMTISKIMIDLVRILLVIIKILLHALIQNFDFSDKLRSDYISELMSKRTVLEGIEVEVRKYV